MPIIKNDIIDISIAILNIVQTYQRNVSK